MTKEQLFAIRKQNLNRLMLDKFQGNRAALSRAAAVHPNHINLILSNNDEHKRNLGELLARKIETQLGLPQRWLDTPHEPGSFDVPIVIERPPIHESLRGALRTCEQIAGISLTSAQASTLFKRVTAVENLIVAAVDTQEMAPELSEGDTVIVDTAVQGISGDGIYIVAKSGGAPMLRRIGRSLTGETTMSSGGEAPAVLTASALKSMKTLGRIALIVKFGRV